MKLVPLQDTVILYETAPNKYGDMIVVDMHSTAAAFTLGMGENYNDFTENISSSAHTYLDPEDPWVLARCMRLEGYYLSIERYGQEEWFKIESVQLGETKLTDNDINNIHVTLSKCNPIELES